VTWLYCLYVNKLKKSDTIEALAEDHFNDVISNIGALITAAIAVHTPYWWSDPIGAIVMSIVIVIRWLYIIHDQVRKIVGYTAPPEFINEVSKLSHSHIYNEDYG
jgi:divalent metal cation (Fe/Co/Zn/Cd) transporter